MSGRDVGSFAGQATAPIAIRRLPATPHGRVRRSCRSRSAPPGHRCTVRACDTLTICRPPAVPPPPMRLLQRPRQLQCNSAQARARLLAVHGQPDIASSAGLQDCPWPRLIVRASACTLWPLMCARPARMASIGVTSPDTDSAPAVAPCRRPTYDRAGLRTADVPVPLGPSAPHYTYPLSHSLSVQNEVLLFSSSFFKKIRIKA